ncbi:hypothetical protein ACE38V_18555 [Cytobacillus sp. Hz8]|uniref:hypothetical protein n=1 Tax=Cytobacillus sp. Hz8 TaxID=3347168 RepID=UPI0035DD257C
MSRREQNFIDFARDHIHQEVEVVTSDGTFTGTLISVHSDHLVLESRIRGRETRIAIRIALIVALFRIVFGRRGPFFGFNEQEQTEESSSQEHHED